MQPTRSKTVRILKWRWTNFTAVREVLRNNYQSPNLIGHYHFWVISPRNSTLFTRPFLAGRRVQAGHETTSVVACLHDSSVASYLAGKKNLKAGLTPWLENGSWYMYCTSHGWYFCSFVHSDVMRNLSRAVTTNLPPSQSLELLKTLGKGMGEVQNQIKFRKEFITGLRHLGGSSVEQQLERMKQV